jgi:hypothetical protein
MKILKTLGDLFGRRASLDRISMDDLEKERVRLEQIEKRLSADLDEVEQSKQQLFEQGRQEKSQRRQVALARKIRDLDSAARAKDRQLSMVSKQSRVLTGLLMLKENQQVMQGLGVLGTVGKMDLGRLEAMVERATVEGQFQMERFTQVLGALESPELSEIGEEDEEVLDIVAAMQESREAEGEVAQPASQEETNEPEGSSRASENRETP